MVKYHCNGIKHTKHCTYFLYENPLKQSHTVIIYIVLYFTMLSALIYIASDDTAI
jgi:hypothetical protein